MTFGISTVVWVVSAFVPEPYRYGVWFLGMAVVLGANMLPRSIELYDRFPIDVEHLTERFGLLLIIVLGESFVKVLSYLSGTADPTNSLEVVRSLLPLLITFTIWWV